MFTSVEQYFKSSGFYDVHMSAFSAHFASLHCLKLDWKCNTFNKIFPVYFFICICIYSIVYLVISKIA